MSSKLPRAPATPPANSPDLPAATDSATRMLEVAEKLFAEHGIEGVSLQRVVTEAGQKNRSAVRYHFGTLPDLVAHLINLRLRHLKVLRHQHLDAIEAAGMVGDVHGIVAASVQALVDTVRDTPWGRYYVQVLAQATFTPRLMSGELLEPDNIDDLLRARKMLQAALPDLPPAVLDQRIVWMQENIVFGVARWVREEGPALRDEARLDHLIDYCAGGLAAAVTNDAAQKPPARARRTGLARHFR